MTKKTIAVILALTLCVGIAVPVLATGDMGKAGYYNTVSIGGPHSAVITADGDLYTWGLNQSGQLGYSSTTYDGDRNLITSTPTKVPGLANVIATSMGGSSSAALTANGDLYTWGSNDSGELGHGGTTSVTTPTKVPGLANVIVISMGSSNSAAITANGDLYTWGSNLTHGWIGLLGHSEGADYVTTPTRVSGLTNVVAVSLGNSHSAAITASGDLYTWGDGRVGQLGFDVDTLERVSDNGFVAAPTKVPGLANVAVVCLGNDVSAAITSKGELYTWGNGSNGELGHDPESAEINWVGINGTIVVTPTKVSGLSNVVAISFGEAHCAAITADGSIYTWGSNSSGQLGLGVTGSSTLKATPTKVTSLSNVVAVSSGGLHSAALTANGDLYAWGGNWNGQVGDGTTANRNSPVKIMGGTRTPTPIPPPVPTPPVGSITITATASPANGGTVTGGGTFQSGATASLQATPNSGWRFTGWYEGGASVIADADYSFAAAANRTLEAKFVQRTNDDPPFDNPHNDWAEEELIRAFEEDLFPPLLMDPGVDLRAPITRVEFAGIVVKTFENLSDTKVSPASSNPFSDTKDIYALMAYDANLMVGTSATTFAPDMILNRETAATALTRVFKKWYFPDWTYATDSNYTLDHSRPAQFTDDAEISGWAYDSVYFMAANGIIRGFDGGTFRPKNISPYHESVNYATATREQALIIALRMVENMR